MEKREEFFKRSPSKKEQEERLTQIRQKLSGMEYDLKNGTYPNGVPVEYNDEMETLKEEIGRLEDDLVQ